MTCREAGRLGGAEREKVLGKAGYSAMGKNGGNTTKERHGSEFYSEIGRMGGEAVKAAHGREYYSVIGRKGAARVRELVAQGLASEVDDKTNEVAGNSSDVELELIWRQFQWKWVGVRRRRTPTKTINFSDLLLVCNLLYSKLWFESIGISLPDVFQTLNPLIVK